MQVGHELDSLDRKLFGQPFERVVETMRFYRSLERLLVLVQEEFAESGLSLTCAARRCGVSPNHLNRRLQETIDLTFHDFLTRYRLLQACQLIDQRDLSLLEVALCSGFGSVRSFQRHFADLLRVSPRHFRNRLLTES